MVVRKSAEVVPVVGWSKVGLGHLGYLSSG